MSRSATLALPLVLLLGCGAAPKADPDAPPATMSWSTTPAGPDIVVPPGDNTLQIAFDAENVVADVWVEIEVVFGGGLAFESDGSVLTLDASELADPVVEPYVCAPGTDKASLSITVGSVDNEFEEQVRGMTVSCPAEGGDLDWFAVPELANYTYPDADPLPSLEAAKTDEGVRVRVPRVDPTTVPQGAYEIVWLAIYDSNNPGLYAECKSDNEYVDALDDGCTVFQTSNFAVVETVDTESAFDPTSCTLDVPVQAIDTTSVEVQLGSTVMLPNDLSLFYAVRDDTGDLQKFFFVVDVPAFATELANR